MEILFSQINRSHTHTHTRIKRSKVKVIFQLWGGRGRRCQVLSSVQSQDASLRWEGWEGPSQLWCLISCPPEKVGDSGPTLNNRGSPTGDPGVVPLQSRTSEEFLTLLFLSPGVLQSQAWVSGSHWYSEAGKVCVPTPNSKPQAERRPEALGPGEPHSGAAPGPATPHTGCSPVANLYTRPHPAGNQSARAGGKHRGQRANQGRRMARQWLPGAAEDRAPAVDAGGREAVQRSKVHVLRWERRGEPAETPKCPERGAGAQPYLPSARLTVTLPPWLGALLSIRTWKSRGSTVPVD